MSVSFKMITRLNKTIMRRQYKVFKKAWKKYLKMTNNYDKIIKFSFKLNDIKSL